ncbi:hypothetical protein UZ36_00745 [Candidatus Nitromaritima sp. SCGC AAA799-C22]|nr:hypothetical protein UZ36_00745 [Candidatus Nitromaritima sp. SCGC AAA799-C22]
MLTTISLFVLALGLFAATYWMGSKKKSAKPSKPPPSVSKPGDPKHPEGYMLLAADAMRSNQFDKARDLASTGLKMNPTDKRTRASLLNIVGNTFAAAKSTDKAKKYFEESIKADPTFAFPHGNLGNLYFMRQELVQAEKEFKTALKLNPRYPDAHNNLGILYKNQGKYDQAAQSFDAALKLDPQLQVARENLQAIQRLR